MDREAYRKLVQGQTRGLIPTMLRGALRAASLPYGLGVASRNLAYDRGWKSSTKAEVPVVSVGNLTVGGTGKTPMVEWVARWFRAHGRRVTLLSRGYGSTLGLNDEGLVLEQNLPDVPHLQAPDRVALARIAVEELEAEILVMDDGFQHRRLRRDLDIVLLDALDPFGGGWLTPGGLLREPVRSLRRADLVVLSRADLVEPSRRAAIRNEADRKAGARPWVEARQAPLDLVDSEGGSEPLTNLNSRRVAAFCGIGNPDGFRRTLSQLGVEPADFRAYADHHPYSRGDVADLTSWAASLGVEMVLTTQKDLVKIRVPTLGPTPLRALRIGLEPLDGAERLDQTLRTLLSAS